MGKRCADLSARYIIFALKCIMLRKKTHLTTEPYTFDIKHQCNSENYRKFGLLGEVRNLYFLEAFPTRGSTLVVTGSGPLFKNVQNNAACWGSHREKNQFLFFLLLQFGLDQPPYFFYSFEKLV